MAVRGQSGLGVKDFFHGRMSPLVVITQTIKQLLVESAKEQSYCKEPCTDMPVWKKVSNCTS